METRSSTDLPPVAVEYNGRDRNAFLFGWTPKQNSGTAGLQ